MIAITLGLILVAIIAQIYVGSKQTYRAQDDLSRLQEDGRYAMEMISRSLRLAGYRSDFTQAYATSFPASNEAIGGTEGASNAPDTLIVRHFGSGASGTPDNSIRDCTGTAFDGATRAQMTFSVAGGALLCQRDATAAISLINNIQDLQISYGVDTDADGVVNQFVSASPAPTWDNVLVVRLCIEMQTANDKISPAAQTYTNCSGTSVTAGDRRVHRIFTSTVALRNRLP
jgi:type IV pilus assembly protein PilW